MKRLSILIAFAAAVVCGWGGVTHGDVSKGVQAALEGKILITSGGLPVPGDDDAVTIKALKKAATSHLEHERIGGVATWRFSFMAFMDKKPGVKQVALDFYRDDGSRAFVAQERLIGINPRLTLLQGDVEMTEDDGLSIGKSYIVRLVARVRGKDVVLAKTKLMTR